MTIMGQINVRKRTGMSRGEPSRKLSLEGAEPSFKGEYDPVQLFYLSRTGMLLETDAPLSVSEPLDVLFPEAEACTATVVWANEDLFACRFEKELKTATISGIKLQSPHKQAPNPLDELFNREEGPDETLGQRITRLRQNRGYTIVHLAGRVGVSKPTLCKWEKDAVYPRQNQVQAIARELEVSEIELLYGKKGSAGADIAG